MPGAPLLLKSSKIQFSRDRHKALSCCFNNMALRETIPWVEKYRPSTFDDIVLDDMNRLILKNIVDTNSFPNLLLYGPPGTGKTTTIINLINKYVVNTTIINLLHFLCKQHFCFVSFYSLLYGYKLCFCNNCNLD